MAEYKDSIRERLEKSAQEEADSAYRSALIEKAGDNIEADIPDAMVEEQMDNMMREYDQNLQMSGLNLELYLKYLGQDARTFREQCRPTAERRVRTDLVLDKIAETEGIEVSDEEVEAEYAKLAEQYGMEADKVKAALSKDVIVSDVKTRKAAEIIYDTGVPTEPVAEEPAAEGEEKPAPKKRAPRKKKAEEPEAEEPAAEGEEKPAPRKRAPRKKKAEEPAGEEPKAE